MAGTCDCRHDVTILGKDMVYEPPCVRNARQVPDARERYKQLLYYAKKLPPMPTEEHTDDNKVKGCVSQVGCRETPCMLYTPCLWLYPFQMVVVLSHITGPPLPIGPLRLVTQRWAYGSTPTSAPVYCCGPPQVWVVGELHDDKKLHWRADSDSELTKASGSLGCRLSRLPMPHCQLPLVQRAPTPRQRRNDLLVGSAGSLIYSVA